MSSFTWSTVVVINVHCTIFHPSAGIRVTTPLITQFQEGSDQKACSGIYVCTHKRLAILRITVVDQHLWHNNYANCCAVNSLLCNKGVWNSEGLGSFISAVYLTENIKIWLKWKATYPLIGNFHQHFSCSPLDKCNRLFSSLTYKVGQ